MKNKNLLSSILLGIVGTSIISGGVVNAYNTLNLTPTQKIQEVKNLGILKIINNNKATYLKVIKGFMNLKQVTDGQIGLLQAPKKITGNPDVDNYVYTSNILFGTNITKYNYAKPIDMKNLLLIIKKYFGIDYPITIFKNTYTNNDLAVIIDDLYHMIKSGNNKIETKKTAVDTSAKKEDNVSNIKTNNIIVKTEYKDNKISNGKAGNLVEYGLNGKIVDSDITADELKNTILKVKNLKNDKSVVNNEIKQQNNISGNKTINGDLNINGNLFVNGKKIDPNKLGTTQIITNSTSTNSNNNDNGPKLSYSPTTHERYDSFGVMARIRDVTERIHKIINPTKGDIATVTTTGEVADSGLNWGDYVRTTGNIDQNITGNKEFNDNVVIDGDLLVKGTKTEVNTTNLTVKDKTITLNKGGTTANADGSGLKVEGDNGSTVATLTYDKNNNRWNDGTDDLARKSEIDHLNDIKADKVSNATAGNFAGLDSSGNLTDSGVKDSDLVHKTGDETISGVKTFNDSETKFGNNDGAFITVTTKGNPGVYTQFLKTTVGDSSTGATDLYLFGDYVKGGDGSGIVNQYVGDNSQIDTYQWKSKIDGTNKSYFVIDANNKKIYSPQSDVNVGIGTDSPSDKLDLRGTFRIGDTSDNYGTMEAIDDGNNGTLLDINPIPGATDKDASVRLFRKTNTSGAVSLDIFKGDNSTNKGASISGNGNSYLGMYGNVGIGTTSPSEKVEVNGAVKIGDTSSDTPSDGTACDHVGTIAYDSGSDHFYGCVDNSGSPEWKQLDN